MISAHLVLAILALVCFLLAALEVTGPVITPGPQPRRASLIAAGLFLWLISTLVRP